MKKIINKSNIISIIKKIKNDKKKIVLCHGVFDVVHYGHILHFKSAKKFGDILVVSITKDKFIKKGLGRPVFNENQRINYLCELKIIDYIYICETESAEDSIKSIKPDFYIKGPDYKHNYLDKTKKIYAEKSLVKKNGGQIKYTADIQFSSSNIINEKNLLTINKDQFNYLKLIKNRFGYDYIKGEIKKFKKIKTLVIGELIFDHYCFGDIIGKSGKEPHLVLKENNDEFYTGGSGAIARHLSSFVSKVDLISPFGEEKLLKKIIKNDFSNNINCFFLRPYKNYSSIIKKRYIDRISNYKMFGSYILPNKADKKFSDDLIRLIKKRAVNKDIILICDYGHDFIDKKTSTILSSLKQFISLNTQLNAANISHHNLNNYKNINSLVINATELRREFRDDTSPLESLANILIKKNKIINLIVTMGKNGAALFRKNSKPIYCPAFVTQSIDKVGAGDAMLSVSSLALKNNLEPEITLFLGSIAAAICVQNIGNKVSINFDELDRIIEYMLK